MMEQEFERLRGLYAAMGDEPLLELAAAKGELTEVAQRAVAAEVSARGLQVAVEETPPESMPELAAAEDDPALVELMTFQIASDAAAALRELDESGIPVRMEPAMRRMVEGGPRVKTNWLTIFVERMRQQEAVQVLRERMGLFPVLEAEVSGGLDDGDESDDAMYAVGDFDRETDAAVARTALAGAGIAYKESRMEDAAGMVTVIEVRLEDMERALALVEAAFAGS